MKQNPIMLAVCWLVIIAMLMPLSSQPAQARSVALPTVDYVPGELLVKFSPTVTPTATQGEVRTGIASLDGLLAQVGAQTVSPLFAEVAASQAGLEHIYKVTLSGDAQILDAVVSLGRHSAVQYVEPNYIFHIQGFRDPAPRPTNPSARQATVVANDPFFAYQWGLHNTGAAAAKMMPTAISPKLGR